MPRCYANPTPDFMPAMRLIASITNANPGVVTTTFDHNYISGIVLRFDIPEADGMQELNGQTATITVTGSDTFAIDIDTTFFSPFSIPDPVTTSPHINICAMVVPIGEVNELLRAAVQNILPGSELP
jgi:hypothetical protein